MEAVFLKLVNMSLTASWLVLAVLILRLVLKDAPKYIRVLLWGIVGLRLIFPFSPESMFSLIPSVEPLPEEFLYAATPQVNTGIPVINNAINPIIAESLTPTTMVTSANPTQIWSFIFSQIWILGTVLMIGYALVSYLLVRRKVAASIRIDKNLRLCDHLDSPFILGIFRPVIYLPSELDPKTADLVLAHEYAHLKRKDHWWKPLGFALLCVYWFNPVMWLAYILLCRDIELACDEKVIKKLGTVEKKAYSAALLHCSVPRKLIAACPLAFGEVGVKDRIKSVLNYKKPAFWIIIAAVVLCIVFAVCFLTDPEKPATPYEITKNLTAEDVEWAQITIWNEAREHISLEKGEIEELVAILAQLKDRDFIESWVDHKVSLMLHCANTEILLQTDGTYTQFVLDSESGAEIDGPWVVRNETLNAFFRKFYPFEDLSDSDEWMQEVTDALDHLRSLEYYHIQAKWDFGGENVLNGQSYIEYWKHSDAMLKIAYIPDDNSTTAHLWTSDGEELKSFTYDGSIDWSTGEFLEEGIPQPWFFSFYTDREDARAISCQYHQDGYTIRLLVNYPAIGETLYDPGSYHADFRFSNPGTLESISVVSESEVNSEYGTFEILPTSAEQINSTIQSYAPVMKNYEYIQDDTQIRMTVSPTEINISAHNTVFSLTDEIYDSLVILDTAGNPISLQGTYGGSQGGNLINMEIQPRTPIDVGSIGSISIGNYQLLFPNDGMEVQTPSMEDVINSLLKKDGTLQIDMSSGEDLILGSYKGWGVRNDIQYARTLEDYTYIGIGESDYDVPDRGITLKFGHLGEICYLYFGEESNLLKMVYDGKSSYYEAVPKYAGAEPIGNILRRWFDQAEYESILKLAASAFVDPALDSLQAAEDFCNTRYSAHLQVSEDSMHRYSYVKCEVEVDMEATELARNRGELGENGYAFYVAVIFLPANDRGAAEYMAGNTHEYTGSDPDVPDGAFQHLNCGYILLTEHGWFGQIVGTGF